MSFTSPVFLFAFLPLTVIVYQLARSTKLKNAVWIAAGLLFYAFGDLRHLPLMLGSRIQLMAICLLLGAAGFADMWLAIFADVGVMILAVLNAIRALFVKKL